MEKKLEELNGFKNLRIVIKHQAFFQCQQQKLEH